MKKIDPEKFYSLLEVQKLTGIKSRQYLSKYVDEKKLRDYCELYGIKTVEELAKKIKTRYILN
jgi:hypothetical protein